jgi:beta-lactamase regulating signal transducer with metallopeptidase domain/HEAT repeat protein
MNWLVTMLLGNTLIALLLAVGAMGAALLRRPAIAHVLWALVLLKLITPALVHVEVPAWGSASSGVPEVPRRTSLAEPARGLAASATSGVVVTTTTPPRTELLDPRMRRAPDRALTQRATGTRTVASNPPRRHVPDTATVLLIAWALGSLTLIGWELLNWRRLARVRRQSEPASPEFTRIVGDVAARIGLPRLPDVRTLGGDFSPVVLPAIGRAVLIVPASLTQNYSADQQRAIVAHELAHLRRGDHWMRVFEIFAAALMWWHPLLWLARRGLREAEEQCCDAWVVALLRDDRRAYADALVDVLERAAQAAGMFVMPRAGGLVTGLGRMNHLRRRLTMIVDTSRATPKSLSPVGWLIVVLLCALLPLAPVRGDDRAKTHAALAKAAPTSAPAVDDATRNAVESLLEMAQPDRTEAERSAAADAIIRFGDRAVPVLIDALRTDKTAQAAQSLLPAMGVEAVERLIDAVDAPQPAVRERALLTLQTILQPGNGVVDVAGMSAPTRPSPQTGLPGNVGPVISPQGMSMAGWVIEPAARASRDADASVRRAGVGLLGSVSAILPDPSVAAPLAAALKDDDATVRRTAAGAMINVARFAPQVTPALARAVGDRDQAVRVMALNAVGAAGAAAKEAMPVITAALKDPDPAVRVAAAKALGGLQIDTAQPQPQQPGGFTPGGYGVPAEGRFAEGLGDPAALASNLWHWTSVGRMDLAKSEAEKLLKFRDSPQMIYGAMMAVAQQRGQDLSLWLKHNRNVPEVKEMVALLERTMTQATQPARGAPPAPAAGLEGRF